VTIPNLFVFDTNALISALLLPTSVPRQALDIAIQHGTLLLSDEIITELSVVFRRPKFNRYISEQDRLQFLLLLIHDALIMPITETITDCRDAKDNKFLELAVAGNATCIVTGDDDLLVLHPYRGIEIVVPRAFVARF